MYISILQNFILPCTRSTKKVIWIEETCSVSAPPRGQMQLHTACASSHFYSHFSYISEMNC